MRPRPWRVEVLDVKKVCRVKPWSHFSLNEGLVPTGVALLLNIPLNVTDGKLIIERAGRMAGTHGSAM